MTDYRTSSNMSSMRDRNPEAVLAGQRGRCTFCSLSHNVIVRTGDGGIVLVTLKKYHGLGNDYLIYDPNQNRELLQERQIQLLCRRNTGVGADGILFGPVLENEKIKVRIFNPDGSEAERSGNGIRIFSKYLKDAGYVKEKCYELWTKAGPVQVEFLDEDASRMKVDMGYAAFGADSIHAVGIEGDMINESVFFCDNFYNITCVSMGNPNCVVMMEEISKNKALHLGPYVENSKYFPNRINMQLCHVVDRENIQIEIYERGAGYTYASGTGACAAASAAHKLGLVGNRAWQVYTRTCPAYIEDISEIHRTEPYVYSQMIAGKDAPNFGEAKNSWLTGTAAWTFLNASQYILGIRPDYDGLIVDPCIPSFMDGFTAKRDFRGTTYHIEVENPNHVEKGIASLDVGV